MKTFRPDNTLKITYDPEAKAFYIYLYDDEILPDIVPTTEILQDVDDGPLIIVDRINDIVIGIEIVT